MAYASSASSSSSDSEVDSCSKTCVKAYATLKEQYDNLNSEYNKSQFNLVSYKAVSSTAASPTVESFVNSSEMLENQEYNKSKGYHAVPPPYTGNFIPRKHDLTFMDEIVESENMDVTTVVTPSNVKNVVSNHESAGVKNNGDAVEPKTVRENSFRPPIIEDWDSDDDSEVEFIPNVEDKTVRPSIEKIKFVKYRAVVSEYKGKGANAVKASACWVWKAKNSRQPHRKESRKKGVINSVDLRDSAGKNAIFLNMNIMMVVLFPLEMVKDETSGILKTFIIEIENQLDHEVKVIRSDNGTEFKNSVMNQFYKMKGIKREFSIARNPQQNGVAKRQGWDLR
ncbi:ribonuclease H-like domain-containing protein [Tanacetum coccineum]